MSTCNVCNDTHLMLRFEESSTKVMCTSCPLPCEQCNAGPFCKQTPCSCRCHKKSSMENRDTVPDGADTSKLMMVRYFEDNVEDILQCPDMFGSPDQQELLFLFCLKTLIWLKTGEVTSWVPPPLERFVKKKKILSTVCLCDQLRQSELTPALKEIFASYKEMYE
jgi:hypothetical protein